MQSSLHWSDLLCSRPGSYPACLPHLCQTAEQFVMDDLVIKWERCWVSDRSLRSTWPSVITFPSHMQANTRTHTHISLSVILHAGIQADTHKAIHTSTHTIWFTVSPSPTPTCSFSLPTWYQMFPLPLRKLGPKDIFGADYSIHKFAVKHFYTCTGFSAKSWSFQDTRILISQVLMQYHSLHLSYLAWFGWVKWLSKPNNWCNEVQKGVCQSPFSVPDTH